MDGLSRLTRLQRYASIRCSYRFCVGRPDQFCDTRIFDSPCLTNMAMHRPLGTANCVPDSGMQAFMVRLNGYDATQARMDADQYLFVDAALRAIDVFHENVNGNNLLLDMTQGVFELLPQENVQCGAGIEVTCGRGDVHLCSPLSDHFREPFNIEPVEVIDRIDR